MAEHEDPTTGGLERREFLKRAAVFGLGAAALPSVLAACATGGGGDDTSGAGGGETELTGDPKNPFGVDAAAALDVVIFNGGFGDEYAKYTESLYKDAYPDAKVKHTPTQDIQSFQSRFVSGNPPDVMDNSGDKALDNATLVTNGQLAELSDLFAAPSVDDENVTVEDSLVSGVREAGTIGDGVYQLNFVQSAWALWHDAATFDTKGWEPAATDWDAFMQVCADIKKDGSMAPFVYTGVYPQYLVGGMLNPMVSRVDTQDVWIAVDNLEDGAWDQEPIRKAAECLLQLKTEGFLLRGLAQMTHTQSQTAWLQHKAAFLPCGSWLENEMKSTIPDGFELTAETAPSVPGSAIDAALMPVQAGEPLIVPADAKNVPGGKEFCRLMVSKKAAQKFAELTHTATIVKGAHEEQSLGAAFDSTARLITASTDVAVWSPPKYAGWYKPLGDAVKNALNQMMLDDSKDVDWFIATSQKAADDVKKDKKIKKFTR